MDCLHLDALQPIGGDALGAALLGRKDASGMSNECLRVGFEAWVHGSKIVAISRFT